MTRILKVFKKKQIMRRIENKDFSEEHAVAQTEAFTGKKADLKKQSQFTPAGIGANLLVAGGYGDISMLRTGGNKADLTLDQCQYDAPPLLEMLLKSKKPPSASTG